MGAFGPCLGVMHRIPSQQARVIWCFALCGPWAGICLSVRSFGVSPDANPGLGSVCLHIHSVFRLMRMPATFDAAGKSSRLVFFCCFLVFFLVSDPDPTVGLHDKEQVCRCMGARQSENALLYVASRTHGAS
jgi:hypothetical protein